jgi:hypothetical protein
MTDCGVKFTDTYRIGHIVHDLYQLDKVVKSCDILEVEEFQIGEIVLDKDSNEALKQSLIEPLNALRMPQGKICTG